MWPETLNAHWREHLQHHEYAPNTIKKYPQVVAHFLDWYEQQEHVP